MSAEYISLDEFLCQINNSEWKLLDSLTERDSFITESKYRTEIGDYFSNDFSNLERLEKILIRIKDIVKSPLIWNNYYHLNHFKSINFDWCAKIIVDLKDVEKTQGSEFSHLLLGDGKKLLPLLLSEFKNSKPQEIVTMVLALVELKLLEKSILQNKVYLHSILTETFGHIGSRQGLSYNFSNSENNTSKVTILLNTFRDHLAKV